jgi:isochorismate synthase
MNIVGNRFYLYAGGGLLTSSTEQQEWQETEAKLQTMQQVLNCKCQIVKHTDV